MKRSLRLATIPLVLLLGSAAHASAPPNLDRYLSAPDAAPKPASARRSPNGFAASVDEKRGVPTFFWADPARSAPPAALGKAKPEDVARAFLTREAKLYGLSPAALATAYVREVHDTGRGGIIVIFGQRVDGVEVFQTEMKVLLDRSGALVAIGGNLHGAAAPKHKTMQQAFSKGPVAAVAGAASDAFGAKIAASDLATLKKEKAGYRYFDLTPSSAKVKGLSFRTPARAKRVMFGMPERLVPAYYLEVDGLLPGQRSSDLWGYVIDAATGQILVRRHLVQDAAFKYRVWADQAAPFTPMSGPQADYAPHPTGQPDGSVPAFAAPTLITIEGFNKNPNGVADPWLDQGASVSTGNNVDAYADIADPDGFGNGDLRATPNGALTFDRVYDVAQAPGASQDQRMASITQLFYVNNWLHDYWYDSGFDEAAGNAQQSNLGRGGAEGDPVHAEAQDSSGLDNADMATPADGESPRMQMYLWDGVATSVLNVQPINLFPASQGAAFGPGSYNVTAQLILANDNAGQNPNDACQNLQNNVSGKIVLIERGACTFESKVLRAQQAGAVGVLIFNNQNQGLPGMTDDPNTQGVNIPSLGISQADGNTLKTSLANQTLTVTMSANGAPQRDGSIDNDIVIHEWGHYMHQRLVACGSEQCGGQSEGWADFDSMIHKVREGDNVQTGTYACGIYVTEIFGDAGYFGVRRFPYSNDMTKNGLTFKHVTNGESLPPGPIQVAAPDNWEPHNVGEVWTTMLFQAYTNLLVSGGHTFTEAKRRMADYVVAGMKLAPANPTITEQRDGVLAAAQAADPNDFMLLAQGFAKRGAGTCAVSPARNSSDGSGVVEDFEVSGQPALVDAKLDDALASCDNDGVLDAGEIGNLTVQVRNQGAATLAGTTVTVTSNTPGVTFPNGSSQPLVDLAAFQSAPLTFQVALDSSVNQLTKVSFSITLSNPAACDPNVTETRVINVHYDDVPNDSTTETFDSEKAPWTKWANQGFEGLEETVWSRDVQGNGNARAYGQDYTTHSDTALVSPDLQVGAGNFTVTFAHAHDFESSPQNPGQPPTRWDGGVLEVSKDGGATWEDVTKYTASPYNGTIANVPGADNPLADRAAFVAQNNAWPNNGTVTLNFGAALANQTVKLRFRLGTDAAAGVPDYEGWYFDDVAVTGITNKPFRTVKANVKTCDNLPPIADAGDDLIVNEGDIVTLDASGSSDPDGDPLSFQWSQTVGQSVALTDPTKPLTTFTAPQVGADTTLTFQVQVSDPTHSSNDTVNVLVKDLGGTGGTGGDTGGTLNPTGGTAGSGATGGEPQGGGGAGGTAGTGGSEKDIVVTACTCDVPGKSTGTQTGTFLAPLFALGALLLRRRKGQKES